MPDKVQADKSELSPTILAFYEEPNNTATNIASIPQVSQREGRDSKNESISENGEIRFGPVNEKIHIFI